MSDFSRLTSKAVSGLFFEGYEKAAEMAFSRMIAWLRTDSVQSEEIYANPVSTGGMGAKKGELKLNDGTVIEYRLPNVEYEDALSIDRRHFDYDQTGTARRHIAEKANRAAVHDDILLTSVLEANPTG